MADKRDLEIDDVRIIASRAEVEASFRSMILKISCPYCGEPFTDRAVDWGDAWQEGRRDTMRELDTQERDGPYKIKCELCNQRSFINYFAATASKADRDHAGVNDNLILLKSQQNKELQTKLSSSRFDLR